MERGKAKVNELILLSCKRFRPLAGRDFLTLKPRPAVPFIRAAGLFWLERNSIMTTRYLAATRRKARFRVWIVVLTIAAYLALIGVLIDAAANLAGRIF